MTPDISQMSPEERATRLYNRVMTLHAAGKNDSAEFFLPMALQAYRMVPLLDIDSHYHMGVLQLTGGNAEGALAEADSIRRLAPAHLFGFVLRAQALELKRDPERAKQAYRDFLKNEGAERARALPEYTDHAQNLDSFHTRALEATGGK
jgi:lipoprotein NlpI